MKSVKTSVLVGLAFFTPVSAVRKKREGRAAIVDCAAYADLVVDGKEFGKTLESVCNIWPPELGEFPVGDVGRAGEILGKAVDEGGAWDQIQEIRESKQDRGFCWRNTTLRSESGECPPGYQTSGLTGLFKRSCKTGCMWSSHPVSCGFGCATSRRQCADAIVEQTLTIAEAVAHVYGFVAGDDRIGRAVGAIINLSEFLLATLPPITDAIKGALDILTDNEHGAYVAVILFEYLKETAPDVRQPAEAIRDAIKEFGAIIAELAKEKKEGGTIDARKIVDIVLEKGEHMLDFAVNATKIFTHPKCGISNKVAFTIETVGDDRLMGPWLQRGEIKGHPRYTLAGDRSTNLEWSNSDGGRWVMFSDGWSGIVGRKYLYESLTRSSDYPLTAWRRLDGDAPVPEFVPVQQRVE